LRTFCGSNVPARSRGTSISTWPSAHFAEIYGASVSQESRFTDKVIHHHAVDP
jgi:hypothetical protein